MIKKQDQLKYFSLNQPHLKSRVDNYTSKLTTVLVETLVVREQDKVLEVGSGEGRFTFCLVNKGLNVTATDFAPNLLSKLKESIPKISVIESDIDEIDKSTSEKFDKVVGFFILHHLPDIKESLSSIRKVLKSGGEVGFVEPNALNPLYYIQPFVSKNMSWEEEKGLTKMRTKFLTDSLHKCGFKDTSITTFGFFPPFVVNTSAGLFLDDQLEKIGLFKKFLPFLLIRAKV